MHRSILTAIALALFVAAAAGCQKSRGIVVNSIEPPQIDITSEVALKGDDVLQQIIIEKLTDSHGRSITGTRQAFYIRNALRDALTETGVFNFVDSSTLPNVPGIAVSVLDFDVDKDVVDAGFTTRRGHAEVNFSMQSTARHIVGSTTESAEIVNRQPLGSRLTPPEEIMQSLAEDVCTRFVKKLVPTRKREFREFASGNDQVEQGIQAAFNNDWSLAMRLWNKALQDDAENDAAWYNLGLGHEKAKQYGKASANYAKARELDPENALYLRTYAKCTAKINAMKQMNALKDSVRDNSVSGTD